MSPTPRRQSPRTARSTWATATTRWTRTPATRTPRNSRSSGRYNHGHEGDIWQHPVIAPVERAAGGHHLLHPRPDPRTGGHLHRPHRQRDIADGEVEVQDRQLRQAVFPGDRRERHHLLRRSGRLCLRLRGQGSLSGQCTLRNSRAELFVHQREPRDPSCCGRSRSARLLVSARRPSSPRIRTRSTSARSPARSDRRHSHGTSPRSTSPIRAQRPCPPPPIRWTFQTIGKVDQTPALGRDGTLYVPAINMGPERLYAISPMERFEMGTFGPINPGSETSAQPIVAG